MKTCTKCGVEKSLDDFHNSKSSSTGKVSQCKECVCERSRKWNAENKERKSETGRKWREKNLEKDRASSAQWRKDNPERFKEGKRKAYEKNKEHYIKKNMEWVEANPLKVREIKWKCSYLSRMRKNNLLAVLGVGDEEVTVVGLLDRWGEYCFHCGGPFECLDHFPIPVKLGGEHSLSNVRPSCMSCNAARTGLDI